MKNEQLIPVPDHLLDHNYFCPVVYENNPIQREEGNKHEIVSSDEDSAKDVAVGVSKTYILIPGVQHRTRIFLDNLGFKYYKRHIRGNCIYLVCERQKNRGQFCPSTASVSTDQRDNRIVLRRPHNHQPRVINLYVRFLREAIGERGNDPTVSTTYTRSIYNNEIVNHEEAAFNYSIVQAQARVKKMRRLRLP